MLRAKLGERRVFFDEFYEAEIAGHDADTSMNLTTPYNMPGDDVVSIRYFINAKIPGIYWINCNVAISEKGIDSQKVAMNLNPIAVAFYKNVKFESVHGMTEFPPRNHEPPFESTQGGVVRE